ncbi:MAG: hypothetical protein KAU62_09770 [Candidatus Heimdallarchaeota archaeon]|nr:hypothetical protein [Candidatus Heimdallarchaeota archaeon]MCK4611429.1 hypothetical protein [Candidatus Heimdallarchaeota archaeon]
MFRIPLKLKRKLFCFLFGHITFEDLSEDELTKLLAADLIIRQCACCGEVIEVKKHQFHVELLGAENV